MNLLPQSNGVRKVNMKKQRNPKEKFKFIAKIIVIIILVGFVIQRICNFVAGEFINQRVEYTTVDDKRMDYRINGSGKYTIVFDGAIGTNLEAWTPIVNQLQSNGDDVTTFVYNRAGYGFSGVGSRKTTEEQAQALKILLRKSGATAPYILVGEEYGSLVLTSFAKQFPDSVAGVVLVDPLNEGDLKTSKYSIGNFINILRRGVEEIGSNIGLTMALDKLHLTINMKDYTSMLDEESLKEFKSQRTKSNYTTAVMNETINLLKETADNQKDGIFNDKPYYLLIRNNDTRLASLGNENLTTVAKTKVEKKYLSLNAQDDILAGIRKVIDSCNN